MKSCAPTIESLKNKAPRELRAIFRNAAGDAVSAESTQTERAAATLLIHMILRCLALRR